MVSAEKNLPDTFDPATGKNIKWVADIGTETHDTPVIAGGKVLIDGVSYDILGVEDDSQHIMTRVRARITSI